VLIDAEDSVFGQAVPKKKIYLVIRVKEIYL